MKTGAQRRREGENLPPVPFPLSLAVHHRSLAFRARLYHAKNEAPEEKADSEALGTKLQIFHDSIVVQS